MGRPRKKIKDKYKRMTITLDPATYKRISKRKDKSGLIAKCLNWYLDMQYIRKK